jgi:hypothetical protein
VTTTITYAADFYAEDELADRIGMPFSQIIHNRVNGHWLPHAYIDGQYYYNKEWADHYLMTVEGIDFDDTCEGAYGQYGHTPLKNGSQINRGSLVSRLLNALRGH